MPRQSSRGRPAPRATPRHEPVCNPPQPARHAPPPTPAQGGNGGSMLGSIGATIAEGMAIGTGSAIAHKAVDAILGPRTIRHEKVVTQASAAPAPTMTNVGGSDSCSSQYKAFQDCLKSGGNDIGNCQFFMDLLLECKRNNSG